MNNCYFIHNILQAVIVGLGIGCVFLLSRSAFVERLKASILEKISRL